MARGAEMTTRYRRNIWARISDWQYGVKVYWVYHGKCIASAFAGGFAFGVFIVLFALYGVIGLTW
jgi:hypothetical protein